jgi:hypothetical protein
MDFLQTVFGIYLNFAQTGGGVPPAGAQVAHDTGDGSSYR